MEYNEEGGLYRSNMELIRGFLVYVARTYRDINPYLKGLYWNLDRWRPFRDNEGGRMQGDQLKLEDMVGKWEKAEEEYKPLLVRSVHCLKIFLEALKHLTERELPPRRRLKAMRQAVAYLMGDASGLGFGLVMWYQSRLV